MDTPSYLKPQISKIDEKIADAEKLLADPSMSSLAHQEISELKKQKTTLLSSFNQPSTVSRQPSAGFNSCILEFRGAAGGEEAKIWADDLMHMY
ncbi:PCRF domain-containing protein, partial [Candidatus Microgenomates bacterium]|nr:PCRF domain-containing protein [Candidatus Microgenomates bacterium]